MAKKTAAKKTTKVKNGPPKGYKDVQCPKCKAHYTVASKGSMFDKKKMCTMCIVDTDVKPKDEGVGKVTKRDRELAKKWGKPIPKNDKPSKKKKTTKKPVAKKRSAAKKTAKKR